MSFRKLFTQKLEEFRSSKAEEKDLEKVVRNAENHKEGGPKGVLRILMDYVDTEDGVNDEVKKMVKDGETVTYKDFREKVLEVVDGWFKFKRCCDLRGRTEEQHESDGGVMKNLTDGMDKLEVGQGKGS